MVQSLCRDYEVCFIPIRQALKEYFGGSVGIAYDVKMKR